MSSPLDRLLEQIQNEAPPLRGAPNNMLHTITELLGESIAEQAKDPKARDLLVDKLLDDPSFPVHRTTNHPKGSQEDRRVVGAMLDTIPFMVEDLGNPSVAQASILRIMIRFMATDYDAETEKVDRLERDLVRVDRLERDLVVTTDFVSQHIGSHANWNSDLDKLEAKVADVSETQDGALDRIAALEAQLEGVQSKLAALNPSRVRHHN